MSADTLVGTPDPPDDVEAVVPLPPTPEPEPVLVPTTTLGLIDYWLDHTRFRTIYMSGDVTNILLDIRNALTEEPDD